LLDTILAGFQASSLLNVYRISGMSGELCVSSRRNQGETYAMMIGEICFCNDKQRTQGLKVASQLLCVLLCVTHDEVVDVNIVGATSLAQPIIPRDAVVKGRVRVSSG
jgi:hypothetical protein